MISWGWDNEMEGAEKDTKLQVGKRNKLHWTVKQMITTVIM